MPDFFDSPIDDSQVVLVDATTLHQAQQRILGCEACSEDAEIPFDWILDSMTGNDPSWVDYLLAEPAKCPRCFRPVTEKTLVERE